MQVEYNKAFYEQELEVVANSEEFKALNKYLSEHNVRWSELDYKLKLTATYFLMNHSEEMIPDLWRLFFKRKTLSIEEFLKPEIIGPDAHDLFPMWREQLISQFKPNNKVYEWVIGGSIGSGKTTFANIAHMYNLYRVSCMRYPHATLGAGMQRSLVQAFFSVTREKAKSTVLRSYLNQIELCKYFTRVRNYKDFEEAEREGLLPFYEIENIVYLPNKIELYAGSGAKHALSNDLFGVLLDEAEFRTSMEDAMNVYTQLKERVDSRFLGSRFTLVSLISSARYSTGIIAEYLKGVNLKESKSIKYFSFPIWEVRYFDSYKEGYFHVMRGTKTNPSRILSKDESDAHVKGEFKIPNLCKVIKVPLAYKAQFVRRIEDALRNLAGLQTYGSDLLFDDTSKIEKSWLQPEFNLDAPLVTSSDKSLYDKLPSELFQKVPGTRYLKRVPLAQRYIHLDAAEVNEAGLCMLHKELDMERNVEVYVVDFICYITSDNRISLDDIASLVVDLHQKSEVNFAVLTTDQFQSSHIRQLWFSKNISTQIKHLSVDKTMIPYEYLSKLVDSERVFAGHSPKLRNQLQGIEVDDNDKVYSMNRKDMSDALCGAVYNAFLNTKDVPIYRFGEDTSSKYTEDMSDDLVEI